MCTLRLSVKALRASRFERSTQPVKYRIESHIACEIAATIESQSLPVTQPIASGCAPPWRSEPRSKAESSNQSLPDVRHRGHRNPIASRCAPPWRSEPRSKPASIPQSLPDVRHRGHENPIRNQNRAANRMPTRTENRHRNRPQINAKSNPEGSK